MNKREIVIILVAALIAVYGVFDYFILSDKNASQAIEKAKQAENQVQEFLTAAIARIQIIQQTAGAEKLPYFLAQIASPWRPDPFKELMTSVSSETDLVQTKEHLLPPMIYSGFIMAGKRKLAIINGMEYIIGDTLPESDGYQVAEISPGSVTVISRDKQRVTLKIKENR